jgi:hypothetical protein
MKSKGNPSSESESAKFLARGKNIKFAYEIWEAFPSALVLAHWQFWFDLEKTLTKKLKDYKGWELDFSSESEDPSQARETGSSSFRTYIGLVPTSGRSSIYCYPCVQQLSKDKVDPAEWRFKLWMGISLSEPRPNTWKPAIRKLIEEELGEAGYKWHPDWWWLAYSETDYGRYPKASVMERLANGNIAQEVSGIFVDFIKDNLKLVKQINAAI